MNILEGNKIIAEYLGYKYYPFNSEELSLDGVKGQAGWKKYESASKLSKINKDDYLCRNHKDLPFVGDYNWLMFVVEILEKNHANEFKSSPEGFLISQHGIWVRLKTYTKHHQISKEGKRFTLFKAIVDFITFLNEKK